MLMVLHEFEEKCSQFYGIKLKLVALSMDAWLCTNIKDLDNIDLFWDVEEIL